MSASFLLFTDSSRPFLLLDPCLTQLRQRSCFCLNPPVHSLNFCSTFTLYLNLQVIFSLIFMTNIELYKVTLRDTTFHLDRSQIEFDSPNYFTGCFLGSFAESNRRETRSSRDPVLFVIILNYLSGYTIFPLLAVGGMAENAVVENLLSDALFYGLDELADVLEEYRSGKKAIRKLEEKVVKSYLMVVWPVRTSYSSSTRYAC